MVAFASARLGLAELKKPGQKLDCKVVSERCHTFVIADHEFSMGTKIKGRNSKMLTYTIVGYLSPKTFGLVYAAAPEHEESVLLEHCKSTYRPFHQSDTPLPGNDFEAPVS